jgi:hypothetical protein
MSVWSMPRALHRYIPQGGPFRVCCATFACPFFLHSSAPVSYGAATVNIDYFLIQIARSRRHTGEGAVYMCTAATNDGLYRTDPQSR